MAKIIATISLLLVLTVTLSFLTSVSLASAQTAKTPVISVTLISQDPDPVEQGDVVEVRFKVENTGALTSENIYLEILPDYPFSLYSGKAVQDLGKLGANPITVRYKLKVDEEAAEGDNEIRLQLKIGNGIWQTYDENNFLIDVKDYDIPDVQVYLRESTIKQAGQVGTITIEMANTDLADIKFLQLTLLPTEDYQILSSSNYVYIGDVDSDDTETEDFEIYVSKGARDEIILPVLVKYQDINEKKYEESFSIKLRLYDSSDLRKLGLAEKNYFAYIAAGVVVAAALLIYWRSRRKQRQR